MVELKSFLQENTYLEKYINTVNVNLKMIYKGWWSEIISIDEFKKYENTIN